MNTFDPRQELKHLYGTSPKTARMVEVPKLRFLMIDGHGDPNRSEDFQNALEALFSVSYTAKFTLKKKYNGVDYKVMPLEGLWWADDMNAFLENDKSSWNWTAMIAQPGCATESLLREAVEIAHRKKELPALDLLRIEEYEEGAAAQILHEGPFSAELPSIEKLHAFIVENGKSRRGKHHEIYLSDTRRAAPEKWKTIIRQPVD